MAGLTHFNVIDLCEYEFPCFFLALVNLCVVNRSLYKGLQLFELLLSLGFNSLYHIFKIVLQLPYVFELLHVVLDLLLVSTFKFTPKLVK